MNPEIWASWRSWGPPEVIDGSAIRWWGNSPDGTPLEEDGTQVCRTYNEREYRKVHGEWQPVLCPDWSVDDLLRRRGVLLADLEYERVQATRISMRRAICRINVEIVARRGYVHEGVR